MPPDAATCRQTGGVTIELRAGSASCIIDPDDGGRIASLRTGERELLSPRLPGHPAMFGGCFPMVPWAGRIRDGQFTYDGNRYQLELGLPPHAIHGTVYTSEWRVGVVGDDIAEISCPTGAGWPFGGMAHHRIELAADHIRCTLSLTADELSMPAQIGWHPWFPKPQSADIEFAAMYQRDEHGIPTGPLVAPPTGPVDDCFVGPQGPLRLHYPDLTIEIASDCDHWIVFSALADVFCIEPQSGAPDAFNGPASQRLEPGQTLQRWMTIAWSDVLHVHETPARATGR